MPRGPRVDAPGLVHHVIQRGVERRTTFADDADRLDYLERLDRILVEEGIHCFAWALMPNHVHLVLQTSARPLSVAMQRIGTGYSLHFNRRHDRTGHLVQNRFKSRPACDDGDVMTLIRYVHANPLRAGIVATIDALGRFPWCGHGALLGTQVARRFHSVAGALAFFAPERREARARLREWMQLATPEVDALERDHDHRRARAARALADLAALRDRLCAAHGVDPQELASGVRSRAASCVRRELALAGVTELGLTATQVASRIGISRQGVCFATRRAARGRARRAEVFL